MLLSFAILCFSGMLLGFLFEKIKIPKLCGMMVAGMLIGPYVLNLIHPTILQSSAEIRKFALIIILLRAGFSLSLTDFTSMGKSAMLLSFLPGCFEIVGFLIFGPILFPISIQEAFLIGTIMSAVSPAVIVPKMIEIIQNKYGTKKKIPQLILAGAALDDVVMIVLFGVALNLVQGLSFTFQSLLTIPISVLLGIGIGILCGLFFHKLLQKININYSYLIISLIGLSFCLVSIEDMIKNYIPFASLLSIMCMAITLKHKQPEIVEKLSSSFQSIWDLGQILLFALVGALVNPSTIFSYGFAPILLLIAALLIRSIGVLFSVKASKLNKKETLFCCIAYAPKATVQAALASIPLAQGLNCGNLTLTIAAFAIFLTAPIGSFFISLTYPKLLEHEA